MKIYDFIEITQMEDTSIGNCAKLLCYYACKQNKINKFRLFDVKMLLRQGGFETFPDEAFDSELEYLVTASPDRCLITVDFLQYQIIPAVFQKLDRLYSSYWDDSNYIESSSELIDEEKFVGKNSTIDRLILQINHSYKNHCYDACAVLMRRVFEMLIIFTYEHFGITEEIMGASGNFLPLEQLVKKIINNTTIRIGSIKKEFDKIRQIGNYSAHGFTYNAGRKDITDIAQIYRVMLEELYVKAGLK